MGPPDPPPIDPATVALQQQAKAERIEEIRERTEDDTRNLLIRFGRRSAGAAAGGDTPAQMSDRDKFLGMLPSLGTMALPKFNLLKRMGRI